MVYAKFGVGGANRVYYGEFENRECTCHNVRYLQFFFNKKNAHLFEQRTKEPRTVTNTAKRCFYVHKVAFVCPKCMVHRGPCSNTRGGTLFALPIKVVFIRVGPATLVTLKCTPGR